MNPFAIRRTVLTILLLSIAVTFPAAAAKRRAVAHPSRPARVTGLLKGRVIDAVTGLPVIKAKVSAGKSDTTSANGEFEITGAWGYGTIDVEIERTGYTTYETRLAAGDYNLTVQMNPTATATVRRTVGAAFAVDFESLKFGYSSGFSRLEASYEDFCGPNGTTVRHDRTEMRRIVGPATYVTDAACCDQAQTMKVSIELKGQAPADFLFADSCSTTNPMSLTVRDHVSGEVLYIPLTEVAEVVFP